jgi:hypothetical protein
MYAQQYVWIARNFDVCTSSLMCVWIFPTMAKLLI